MILCDLCGQDKECSPHQIDRNEYDICADCWNPLAEKLKGKGRTTKQREMVFLPPLTTEPEAPPPKPGPKEPPKIWGESGRPQCTEIVRDQMLFTLGGVRSNTDDPLHEAPAN